MEALREEEVMKMLKPRVAVLSEKETPSNNKEFT
jgi:hypothetical protein